MFASLWEFGVTETIKSQVRAETGGVSSPGAVAAVELLEDKGWTIPGRDRHSAKEINPLLMFLGAEGGWIRVDVETGLGEFVVVLLDDDVISFDGDGVCDVGGPRLRIGDVVMGNMVEGLVDFPIGLATSTQDRLHDLGTDGRSVFIYVLEVRIPECTEESRRPEVVGESGDSTHFGGEERELQEILLVVGFETAYKGRDIEGVGIGSLLVVRGAWDDHELLIFDDAGNDGLDDVGCGRRVASVLVPRDVDDDLGFRLFVPRGPGLFAS